MIFGWCLLAGCPVSNGAVAFGDPRAWRGRSAASCLYSETGCEFVERGADPIRRGEVGGEFVVAAAQVL